MLKQMLMEWVQKQRWKKLYVDEDFDVEDYLKKITQYFDAEKAAGIKLIIVYEFHDSGKNDGAWTIRINDGKCLLEKGIADDFNTSLYMTAETYRRILMGRLDYARLAYSTGAVRFFGSTLGHRELNSYLSIPKEAGIAAL